MRSVALLGWAWLNRGRRGILPILITKCRFTLDRLQTFFEGRKTAICGTTGEIRAPLTTPLIVPRLGMVDGAPDNEDSARNHQCLHKSVVWRHPLAPKSHHEPALSNDALTP